MEKDVLFSIFYENSQSTALGKEQTLIIKLFTIA
jgi:hypothetical protein